MVAMFSLLADVIAAVPYVFNYVSFGYGSVTNKGHCRSPSLYRSPWWVRSYGQLQSLTTSLYRSPIAGTKLANLSLQTTPCKEDEKKGIANFSNLMLVQT
jgi:hypothetical protein